MLPFDSVVPKLPKNIIDKIDVSDSTLLQNITRTPLPSIVDRLKKGSVNWVWALSGGGAKGAFQVGALLFLHKLKRYRPRAICATSVGAINAVGVAEGNDEGFKKLLYIWLSLASKEDMVEKADWINQLQALETFEELNIEDLIRGSSGSGDLELVTHWDTAALRLSSFIPIMGQVISFLTADRLEDAQRDVRRAVELISEAKFIYSLEPTRQKLLRNIDARAIRDSKIKLRLISVALEDGSRCYVTEAGKLIHVPGDYSYKRTLELNGSLEEKIVNGAIASSAIPLLFPPVNLEATDGTRFTCVDGGVRDTLPTQEAIELFQSDFRSIVPGKKGIIGISCGALNANNPRRLIGYQIETDYLSPKINLLKIADRGLFIATEEVLKDELFPPWGFNDDIFKIFIVPLFNVSEGVDEIDPGLIQINIAYGYMSAFDAITIAESGSDSFDPRLKLSTQLIAQARKYVWELENRAAYHVGPQPLWETGEFARLRDESLADLGYHVSHNFGRSIYESGVLEKIREVKTFIHDLVELRLDIGGRVSLPESDMLSNGNVGNINRIEDWWMEWERHSPGTYGPYARIISTNPFVRTGSPWESFLQVGFGAEVVDPPIPAVDPPPRIDGLLD